MDSRHVLFTPLTDSMDMYASRIKEQNELFGPYTPFLAGQHFSRYIEGIGIDHMRELTYYDRKTLHNFKYFTWVEQQGRTIEELQALWDPDFWAETFSQIEQWDTLIRTFNERSGVLASLA